MNKADQSVADLSTPEVERHHRIDWIVQRFGWVLFALILIAALAGLLGPGPLTHTIEASPEGTFSVDYQILERYEAPARLKIELNGASQPEVKLRLTKSFFDAVTIETISPPPLKVEASDGDPVYVFPASDREPNTIVLRYTPDEFGRLNFAVAVDNSALLEVRQYILP
jgi:hypothetical protein